ncbi:hypothetical protein GCM10010495_72680 [Kitasatospora herbaricolor]|uniref:hypothetical protein n=1 Tax=Kitasatospora herbaricolor TaxID=68217 RepID=UPI00174D7FA6|nr:hypothetical protein [Kitasatospora herbaricolor]MDQ0306829.1 hypothetical protein [Kitasatospora herbaricolor]GGV44709.1 hypothetical protein GCM10010495_72680 [Kitasatospora herbaricolor]
MGFDTTRNDIAGAAIYLRCYPHDSWQMAAHLDALRHMARRLALPEPTVHLDNGRRSRGPLPALERLVHLVNAGFYRFLLVTGPFAFSLNDTEARSIVRQLTETGCRVLELPSPRAAFSRTVTVGRGEQCAPTGGG